MTIQSLKYSHKVNCIANKQSEPTEIIEKKIKKKTKTLKYLNTQKYLIIDKFA